MNSKKLVKETWVDVFLRIQHENNDRDAIASDTRFQFINFDENILTKFSNLTSIQRTFVQWL